MLYHLFTPIAYNSRTLAYSYGSNITGSRFTSVLNSTYMLIVLQYYHLTTYGRLARRGELYILGDDFILLSHTPNLSRLEQVFKDFGLTLSVKKTTVVEHDQEILYLGFYWDQKGLPDQTDYWWIARVCFPERFIPIKGYGRILVRMASIVFQTKRGLQLFKKYCQGRLSYIFKGDNIEKVQVPFWMPIIGIDYGVIPLRLLIEQGWKLF